MGDFGIIESALLSAALAAGGSLLASTLNKPKENKSPVSYPPNEITRGGYVSAVYGRRMVGCNVGFVGDRKAFAGPSSGGTSLGGGGGKSQNLYLEGGWHQLCHGPVRRMFRIFQGGQILYHNLLDNTIVADGANYQAGTANNPGKTGDNFYWRSGRDPAKNAAFQPILNYLTTQTGYASAFPGLCDVTWHRKLLGGSPQWTLMKYEVETVPDDLIAACNLVDIITNAGIQTYFPETTPATSTTRYVTVWFNGQQSIPAGTYNFSYVTGAFRLNTTSGWQTYAPNVPNFDNSLVDGSGNVLTVVPYKFTSTTSATQGANQFATQSDAENADLGATKVFNHAGGPLGIRYGDLTDNPGGVAGTPNPTYSLQLTSGGNAPVYTASIAVQGGAPGSGDSGWNPAAALYVMLCGPFPYGCAMPVAQLDTDALLAMATQMQVERLGVNVLCAEGQAADAAIGDLMSDVGFLLPQVGNVLKPYLIRSEPVPMSVPADLVIGGMPEQQRQCGRLTGDRWTYQYDDVQTGFVTGDVTVDDDAQAFAANRPHAQSVKLNTVTNRTVARNVAMRKTAEQVAAAQKVPGLKLARECRNPSFHAGRTFIMFGELYRLTRTLPDMGGTTTACDALLDQYGDTSILYDPDNDDGGPSIPPADPIAPDTYFLPTMMPRSEWPSANTPCFVVPRVRGSPSVTAAAVYISTSQNGSFTVTVGDQDAQQAGGVLAADLPAQTGVMGTGPEIEPYNDDIEDVPDLTGDAADYNAGALVMVCGSEIMLLESVSAQTDGNYVPNNITRGAFGTTPVDHPAATPIVIASASDLTALTSPLLASNQGGTLWIKTDPGDGNTSVDLSLVTAMPLAVPVNLLATINVLAPAGGSTVYIGQTAAVQWQTADLTGSLTLSYSTDGGNTFTVFAPGEPDTGAYQWATTGLAAAASVIVRVASTTTPTVYADSYPFALAAAVPPPAPTDLTAAPGNTVVFLNWTAAAGAQLYRIYRSVAGGAYSLLSTASAPTGEAIPTSYTDAGLTNGTNYCYEVTAVQNGAESAQTSPACATPAATATGTTGTSSNTSNGCPTDITGDSQLTMQISDPNSYVGGSRNVAAYGTSSVQGTGKPGWNYAGTSTGEQQLNAIGIACSGGVWSIVVGEGGGGNSYSSTTMASNATNDDETAVCWGTYTVTVSDESGANVYGTFTVTVGGEQ